MSHAMPDPVSGGVPVPMSGLFMGARVAVIRAVVLVMIGVLVGMRTAHWALGRLGFACRTRQMSVCKAPSSSLDLAPPAAQGDNRRS